MYTTIKTSPKQFLVQHCTSKLDQTPTRQSLKDLEHYNSIEFFNGDKLRGHTCSMNFSFDIAYVVSSKSSLFGKDLSAWSSPTSRLEACFTFRMIVASFHWAPSTCTLTPCPRHLVNLISFVKQSGVQRLPVTKPVL